MDPAVHQQAAAGDVWVEVNVCGHEAALRTNRLHATPVGQRNASGSTGLHAAAANGQAACAALLAQHEPTLNVPWPVHHYLAAALAALLQRLLRGCLDGEPPLRERGPAPPAAAAETAGSYFSAAALARYPTCLAPTSAYSARAAWLGGAAAAAARGGVPIDHSLRAPVWERALVELPSTANAGTAVELAATGVASPPPAPSFPPSPPPGLHAPSPPGPPPTNTAGWITDSNFAYMERVFPGFLEHSGVSCAEHCAPAKHIKASISQGSDHQRLAYLEKQRIGTCLPRGFVPKTLLPSGVASKTDEDKMSDRGRPFCGNGRCCRAPDVPGSPDAFAGDPRCYGAGCHGRRCCADPAAADYRPITDHNKVMAMAESARMTGGFKQSVLSDACHVTGLGFAEAYDVP